MIQHTDFKHPRERIFSKEAIFSIKSMLISNRIEPAMSIFYLTNEREYLGLGVAEYRENKRLKKENHKIQVSAGSIWVRSLDENVDLLPKDYYKNQRFKGKPIEYLKEVRMCPAVIQNGGRLYHLIQYTLRENEFVTRRLMELNFHVNSEHGRDSFRIEGITEFKGEISFFKEFGLDDSRVLIEISFPYDGVQFYAIQKNSSRNVTNLQFITLMGDEITIADWDMIIPSMDKYALEFDNAYRRVLDSLLIPDGLEIRCEGDRCNIELIVENRFKAPFEEEIRKMREIYPEIGMRIERI